MRIESPAFGNNQYLPVEYTRDGLNVNPPLTFAEVPKGAGSLALIFIDLDAFMTAWAHWLLFNIDPKTAEIGAAGSPLRAVVGLNSAGTISYEGPFPPTGVHRYVFKLYALDISLKLKTGASKEELEMAMRNHVLAQSQLIALYKRK